MTLDQLTRIRLNKQRPKDMVILSLMGKLNYTNPVIMIQGSTEDLDLRSLVGLDVEIFYAGNNSRAVELALEVLHHKPRWLSLVGNGYRIRLVQDSKISTKYLGAQECT